MKEINGDIWSIVCDYRVITTNGVVKIDGTSVMDAGIALAAKEKYPGIDAILGKLVLAHGNHVFMLPHNLISFPTKVHWKYKSNLNLIERSACEIANLNLSNKVVLLPEPGCQNGGLKWEDVKSILIKYLDDRFIVVHRV